MLKKCLNCDTTLDGEYCSHCGQPADTHKINLHYLWHDVQHGILHVDKGFLFTIRELFSRPGNSIREFLEGKRVNHFKPISLVIILAGIYSLLSHYFELNLLSSYYEINGDGGSIVRLKTAFDHISEWLSQHYAFLALLQIPILSIGTYIFFRKPSYNFIEHLVINSFIAGQKLILHIIAFPISYWINKTNLSRAIEQVIDMAGIALAFWTIFQLFNTGGYWNRIWRTICSLLIPAIIFSFLLLLTITIMIQQLKLK